jgi:EmrB/QacA subfamily drug resistance transporter
MTSPTAGPAEFVFHTGGKRPWPALWALVVGFFMILVDATIVTVAMPQIMAGLDADINGVVWVTSAYLLAYAVPALITGRLGDRFGPKRVYMLGLTVFTAASAWCGLSTSIGMLVTARVLQGLGAALMTPQTMAVITRMFPPDRRGAAMGLWGSVAGVATLVGPVVGGVLTDGIGWEWIFFVNVPVGVVGLFLASRLVPTLETHEHSFDVVGVVLSAVGMFLLVFGIQQGESHDWGPVVGPFTAVQLIAAGVLVLVVFVWWQSRVTREPLMPLGLFADRNFSLANVGIASVGFTVTALGIPLVLYFQAVRGMTPTQSALMLAPTAVISGGLAPLAGRYIQTHNPRGVAVAGLLACAVSLGWYVVLLHPDTSVWLLLLPAALLGVANAGMWGPLAVTATRNLPPRYAGAGSGVYNTNRQVGAVLGSAAIAALMEARIAANLPQAAGGMNAGEARLAGGLPEALQQGFSTAMGQALLLPAAAILVGVAAAALFAPPHAPSPVNAEPTAGLVRRR